MIKCKKKIKALRRPAFPFEKEENQWFTYTEYVDSLCLQEIAMLASENISSIIFI